MRTIAGVSSRFGVGDLESCCLHFLLKEFHRPEPGGGDRMVERLEKRSGKESEGEMTSRVETPRELCAGSVQLGGVGVDE